MCNKHLDGSGGQWGSDRFPIQIGGFGGARLRPEAEEGAPAGGRGTRLGALCPGASAVRSLLGKQLPAPLL